MNGELEMPDQVGHDGELREDDRSGSSGAGWGRTGSGQGRLGPDRTGQDGAGPIGAGQDLAPQPRDTRFGCYERSPPRTVGVRDGVLVAGKSGSCPAGGG